jgi:formamidopyrimidine-DNA glycosylase
MPELPDVELYLAALRPRILGRTLARVRVASPFFVRTFDPPVAALEGHRIVDLQRMGKRLVWSFDEQLFVVIHLMIAGRFRWLDAGAPIPGKVGLAAFDFDNGTLVVTEAGSRKQASLHMLRGADEVAALDPGGLEVFELTEVQFARILRSENHTLKRALTDPHLFSGIGNAYSDEILHAARLSPLKLTHALTDGEITALYTSTRLLLHEWTERLTHETGEKFPEKVTAFRKGMAVHGRYRQPCPRCGSPVQRIVYARNEANYCPTCQTGGRLLADRAMSRLLRDDWPKTLEELERTRKR